MLNNFSVSFTNGLMGYRLMDEPKSFIFKNSSKLKWYIKILDENVLSSTLTKKSTP